MKLIKVSNKDTYLDYQLTDNYNRAYTGEIIINSISTESIEYDVMS